MKRLLVFSFALAPAVSFGALMSYNQDFDGLTPGGSALSDVGWGFFSDNAGLGAYNGPAPGAGPQISALADDGAGNQYINFFANYGNRAVHENPPLQETISLFVQQTFTGAEAALGQTWDFTFDYALNDGFGPSGDTTVGAFIRVFDGSFNLLAQQNLDTGGAGVAFTPGSLSQTFDPVWTNGGILQFGFTNTVGSDNGSGMLYDNVSFVPEPSSMMLAGLSSLALLRRRRR